MVKIVTVDSEKNERREKEKLQLRPPITRHFTSVNNRPPPSLAVPIRWRTRIEQAKTKAKSSFPLNKLSKKKKWRMEILKPSKSTAKSKTAEKRWRRISWPTGTTKSRPYEERGFERSGDGG